MSKIKVFFGVLCLAIGVSSALAFSARSTTGPDYYYYFDIATSATYCVEIFQTECGLGTGNCFINIPTLGPTAVYNTRLSEFDCASRLSKRIGL